jgi:hypothetical protein
MISKSKLGAIAFIAAIGLTPLASPAVAQFTNPQYSPSVTGGGSSGYNRGLKHYRLGKHHHAKKLHAQAKPKAAKPSGAGAPAAGAPAAGGQGAGGAAAKQPMGRP